MPWTSRGVAPKDDNPRCSRSIVRSDASASRPPSSLVGMAARAKAINQSSSPPIVAPPVVARPVAPWVSTGKGAPPAAATPWPTDGVTAQTSSSPSPPSEARPTASPPPPAFSTIAAQESPTSPPTAASAAPPPPPAATTPCPPRRRCPGHDPPQDAASGADGTRPQRRPPNARQNKVRYKRPPPPPTPPPAHACAANPTGQTASDTPDKKQPPTGTARLLGAPAGGVALERTPLRAVSRTRRGGRKAGVVTGERRWAHIPQPAGGRRGSSTVKQRRGMQPQHPFTPAARPSSCRPNRHLGAALSSPYTPPPPAAHPTDTTAAGIGDRRTKKTATAAQPDSPPHRHAHTLAATAAATGAGRAQRASTGRPARPTRGRGVNRPPPQPAARGRGRAPQGRTGGQGEAPFPGGLGGGRV